MIIIENFSEKRLQSSYWWGFDCPNRDGTVAHGGCTFVRFQVLEMPSWHRMPLSVSNFIRNWLLCTASGQKLKSIWFIFKTLPTPMKRWKWFGNDMSRLSTSQVCRYQYRNTARLSPDETIEYLAELSERMHDDSWIGLTDYLWSNLWPD